MLLIQSVEKKWAIGPRIEYDKARASVLRQAASGWSDRTTMAFRLDRYFRHRLQLTHACQLAISCTDKQPPVIVLAVARQPTQLQKAVQKEGHMTIRKSAHPCSTHRLKRDLVTQRIDCAGLLFGWLLWQTLSTEISRFSLQWSLCVYWKGEVFFRPRDADHA